MERGYELIKRIAGGGMGEIFVARRTGAGDFEKRVALKFLLPHLLENEDLLRRFQAEARLAARMHHPNIVEIFDVGEADGRPFIAMQLVDGVTLGRLLKDALQKGIVVPLPLIRLIATGLCEALSYAHALTDGKGKPLNVVHRDVTPGNILVSRNGAVLLTDFGIARIRGGSVMTEPGQLRGKASWIAPEQALDGAVDLRADIYSAALTLYDALTGVQPFKRDSLAEALKAVIAGKIEPVASVRTNLTPRLAAAIDRALSKDPEDRFPNAKAFREALIDGPVATAPELAEFVMKCCPEAFDESLLGDAPQEGTRSVVAVTPVRATRVLPRTVDRPADPNGVTESRDLPRSGNGKLLAIGIAVGLVGVGALAGVARVMQGEPHDPNPVVALPNVARDEPLPAASVETTEVAAVAPDVAPTPEGVDVAPVGKHPVRKPKVPVQLPVSTPLQVGFLSADAAPWAEVSLGGKVLDRTPFAKFPLPVGKHTLVFKGPDGATQKRVVTVTENAVTAVRVDF